MVEPSQTTATASCLAVCSATAATNTEVHAAVFFLHVRPGCCRRPTTAAHDGDITHGNLCFDSCVQSSGDRGEGAALTGGAGPLDQLPVAQSGCFLLGCFCLFFFFVVVVVLLCVVF